MTRDRLLAWSAEHPTALDAAFVAALVVVLVLPTAAVLGTPELLVTLALVVPLVWRRTHPVASVSAVLGVAAAQWVGSFAVGELLLVAGDVAVPLSLYAVAAYGPRPAARLALAVALLGALLLGVRFTMVTGDGVMDVLLAVTALAGALSAAAWALGALRRSRLENLAALQERAERLEREREQQVQLGAAAERARIAREMHDVVAHSLSVVIAQADGGRYALADGAGPAGEVLDTIARTGRTALADMRRLLGVLRDPESAPTAPQPDVPAVPALVDGVRASGLPVSLVDVGEPRPLPPALGLAVYRTVQEGLTNVLKHAGPGTPTTVAMRWGEDALELQVDDAGGGEPADDGDGHGLTGVRERAALWGGTVDAGPRPDGGGHRLRVRLPYP